MNIPYLLSLNLFRPICFGIEPFIFFHKASNFNISGEPGIPDPLTPAAYAFINAGNNAVAADE